MRDKKHLYWVVGLVLIVIIICGTLIWLNYNSWTVRFEMDNNTLKAIESIEYSIVDTSTTRLSDFNCYVNGSYYPDWYCDESDIKSEESA